MAKYECYNIGAMNTLISHVSRVLLLALVTASAEMVSAADETAYLFSYFSNHADGGRRGEAAGLHLAWSEDGMTWTALNGDKPLLVPEIGQDKLMRDPSICRGPDGVYHMVWTSSWKDRIIGYASSTNLVDWSEQRAIPVMANEPTARNCWAPEITYCPDDELFYIYWATTIPGRHAPIKDMNRKEGGLNHRIYLTTTADFKTFSPTRMWFDTPFSAIDAAVLRDPKSSDWLCFVKNENHTPAEKNIRLARTAKLADGFKGPFDKVSWDWVEGPSALCAGDSILLYFDCYRNHRYGAMRSEDGGKVWRDVSSELKYPDGMRHGTAFPAPRAFVDALRERFGETVVRRKTEVAPPADVTMLELKMSSEKLNRRGENVRFTGEVKDVIRGAETVQLVLDDWHGSLIVRVRRPPGEKVPSEWGVGARVCATGVLLFTDPERGDFGLEVQADGIQVLAAPPWLTGRHVAIMVGFFLLLAAAALGWAFFLSRQREIEGQLNELVQKERLRLSHDLHDGYQQLLAGCMFRLTAASTLLARGIPDAARLDKIEVQLEGLRFSLTRAQEELRAALWTMTEEAEGPTAMSDLFRYAAARLPQWEGKVSFVSEGRERPMARRHAGALLMILQEAVGNALRHGGAQHVKVRFVFGRKGMALIVADDGCGFDVSGFRASGALHLGLSGMRARAEKSGGRFAVSSVIGRGTVVKVILKSENKI